MKSRPSIADYMIVAISPALIIALIGSLVFFLIELLYQGQYQGRMQYVFALFVFAAVLIGRISIEEGRSRALAFSVILGGAVLLVMARFVEFNGIFARLSLVINTGLIILILWCADRLTWDCTVIDEQQDASGEGLLKTVGMDDEPIEMTDDNVELEGTTGSEVVSEPQRPWWHRVLANTKRTHAPGVWVVYFSMAALPIFGIGQGFIFHQDESSRRFVFKLLFVYVASALGLLLTTSFLGLRRYLRQRKLEMPSQMAGTWLGTGAVMIVALLLFCMLLPRRNAEYSITDLPAFAGAPDDLQSNDWGFGNDGPEEEDAKRQVHREEAEQESGNPGDDEGSGQEQSKDGKGESEQSDSGNSQGDGKKKSKSDQSGKKSDDSGKKEGNEKGDEGDSGGSKDQSQQDRQNDEQGKQSPDSQFKQKRSEEQKKQSESQQREQEQREAERQNDEGKEQQQKKQQQNGQQKKQQSSRKFDPARMLKQVGGGIGALMKLVYWLIVILIVGWFLWRYWAQVRAAVLDFIQALRDLWANLFGGKIEEAAASAESEPVDLTPPPPPFSSFADPFQSGLANQLPLDQLIKYSFEAFEAWARERGFARSIDQTPHEFAQIVAQSGTGVSQEAIRLAELYSRAAYSSDTMPQTSGTLLKQLWQRLLA